MKERVQAARDLHCSRLLLGLVLACGLALAACSDDDSELPPLALDDTSTTAAPPTTVAENETGLDDEAIDDLWAQTLDIFEVFDEDARAAEAAEVAGRIPTEEVLGFAERQFILPDPVVLTSNATYTRQADGSVAIVDCADSSAPSVLGPTTAGFVATAALNDADEAVLTEFETFGNCIQAEIGAAALAAYEQFLGWQRTFWADPQLDDATIGQFTTQNAEDAFTSYLSNLEESGQWGDLFLQLDSVTSNLEIVGYVPGEVRIRNCQQGDETYGLFDGSGNRVDQLEFPWQAQIVIRMVELDGEWRFDELISRRDGACDPGQTDSGLRLL